MTYFFCGHFMYLEYRKIYLKIILINYQWRNWGVTWDRNSINLQPLKFQFIRFFVC